MHMARLLDLSDDLLLKDFGGMTLNQRCALVRALRRLLLQASPADAGWCQATFPALPCLPALRRHRVVPLVCKRFDELCGSPELLESVSVTVGGSAQLPKVRALCCWVTLRVAGKATSLEVRLRDAMACCQSSPCEEGDETDNAAEAATSLAAAATVACAAGRNLLGHAVLGAWRDWLRGAPGQLGRRFGRPV